MGLHYVNFPLVEDSELDVAKPEIVIYEPQPNGASEADRRGLPGVRRGWHAKHKDETPKLMDSSCT